MADRISLGAIMEIDSLGPFTWAAPPWGTNRPLLTRLAVTLAILTVMTATVEGLKANVSFLARNELVVWDTNATPGESPAAIGSGEIARERIVLLAQAETYRRRCRTLTISAVLLHAAIILAAVAIIAGGRRAPWRAAQGLGVAGILASALAYLI